MSNEPVIRVHDLEKRYRVWTGQRPTNLKERLRISASSVRARAGLGDADAFRQEVWALRGISFEVPRGEVMGVIGANGAGKSTLLSILARITEPTAGYAEMHGRVSSLLEVGTGFHPELSGRDNVYLNGAILGMTRSETAGKFDEIIDFSGVGEFIEMPVKRYSSGMQVRLAFAVAAHLDPEILLLDEVLAVGDAEFQARCHARVEEMTSNGRTVLFVSHDVGSVARLSKRAIVLEGGRIAFEGPAEEAVEQYLLKHRPEALAEQRRPGTGESRVRRVTIESLGSGNRFRTGAPLRLIVELDSPIQDGQLEVTIKTTTGAPMVTLVTDLDRATTLSDGTCAVACAIEGLPLRPAAYLLETALLRRGELVDRLDNAGELILHSNQTFGSSMVAEHPAPVVVEHHWEGHAEPGEAARIRPAGGVPTPRG
jgi:lipopolysaccharide transport system ATP-binding protein